MRIEPEQVREIVATLKQWGDLPTEYDEDDLVAEFDRIPKINSHSFHELMKIPEARELMKLKADNGGEHCPVCGQFAKVYRRKIHAGMAMTLVSMYRKAALDWVYLPEVPQKSRDSTGMAWWGLIEEENKLRPDGGRAGWWRITNRGWQWMRLNDTVPKYAYIYDGEPINFDGGPWSIEDALGRKFNYAELMRDL